MPDIASRPDTPDPRDPTRAEIARLRREIERNRRLAATLRSRGPRPRGFLVGLAIGALVATGFVTVGICAMQSDFQRYSDRWGR